MSVFGIQPGHIAWVSCGSLSVVSVHTLGCTWPMPGLPPWEVPGVFIPKPLEDHFLKLNYLYRNTLQKCQALWLIFCPLKNKMFGFSVLNMYICLCFCLCIAVSILYEIKI